MNPESMLKGRGHYIIADMGTEEFPELLEEALSQRLI